MSAILSAGDLNRLAQKNLEDRLQHLLEDAAYLGMVITVTQVPLPPLAMRHYKTVAEVREART